MAKNIIRNIVAAVIRVAIKTVVEIVGLEMTDKPINIQFFNKTDKKPNFYGKYSAKTRTDLAAKNLIVEVELSYVTLNVFSNSKPYIVSTVLHELFHHRQALQGRYMVTDKPPQGDILDTSNRGTDDMRKEVVRFASFYPRWLQSKEYEAEMATRCLMHERRYLRVVEKALHLLIKIAL